MPWLLVWPPIVKRFGRTRNPSPFLAGIHLQRPSSHVEHTIAGIDRNGFGLAGLRKAFLNPGPCLRYGETMEQLDQLQLVVAEVQAARQQVSSVRAQVQEPQGTIAAVESQPDDLALHRQMGGVLIEVADRVALSHRSERNLGNRSRFTCNDLQKGKSN